MALEKFVREGKDIGRGLNISEEMLTSFTRPVGGFWIGKDSDSYLQWGFDFLYRMLEKYPRRIL